MDNKVIGRYRITYLENGFVQEKNLIWDFDYQNIIKPARDLAYDWIKEGRKSEAEKIETDIKETFGDFFTTQSPMFDAIKTGIMVLPKCQGGEHKLKIELITNA